MRIQLLGLSPLAIILCIIFIFLLANYFFLLNKNKFKYILFSSRLLIFFLLIILIINPWIEWDEIHNSNNDLNIYLDNSQSMLLIDSTINFNDKIQELINWADSKEVNSNIYLFGDSTRKHHFKNNLQFNDKSSSLTNVRKNIMLNQNSTHLIITDGNINRGEPLENIMDNNVIIAGIGKDLNNNDYYISSIVTDSLKNNLLDIIITIGYEINKNEQINFDIILSDYQDNIISSQSNIIDFQESGFQDIIFKNLNRTLFSDINKVILNSRIKESNYNNNQQYFRVNHNKSFYKILLLSGGVSNNTKFIKQTIANRFPNFVVEHYVNDKNINYDQINEFSLIIFDNFPFSNNDIKYYKYILDNFSNLPIIYFEGPGLSLETAKKIANSIDMELSLNNNSNQELLMQSDNIIFNDIDFNKFAPSKKNILWKSNNNSVDLIAYFNNGTSTNKSIASMKNKKILTAVFIPNLANINLNEKNYYNSNNMADYISNIILYEYDSMAELVSLQIQNIKYPSNTPIYATIDIDKKLSGLDFYIVQDNLEKELSDTMKLNNKISYQYIYNFIINNPGIYSMQVLGENDYLNYKSNKEYIAISDFNIESQFLYQNQNSISKFKTDNNNNYFNFKNLSSNLNKIKINTIINRQKKYINSLSTQYYWIIFILLLTMEWYLRKKSKLL